MDETKVESLGAKPLQPDLESIANLKSTSELAPLIASCNMHGSASAVRLRPEQDPDDSDAMIVGFDAGRPGASRSRLLPERRRQVERNSRTLSATCAEDLRAAGRSARRGQAECRHRHAHGDRPGEGFADPRRAPRSLQAEAQDDVRRISTRSRRTSTGSVFSSDVRFPNVDIINVAWPDFFKDVNSQLKSAPLDDWKAYLRFHVATRDAPYLSSAVRE